MNRARDALTLDLTRAQARVLEIAGLRLLADRTRLQRGPERRSLEVAVDRLRAARDGEDGRS